MKFYTITAASNFLQRPLISSFHAAMFHGLAERGGKEYPHDPVVWANTDSFDPLLISRTIRGVPEISQPSGDLVVSQRLAEKLRRFRNIRLAPVQFKRLVDVNYQKGDDSWFDEWGELGSKAPEEILRTQPDVPEFHDRIGAFFEVQTYRLNDIVNRYPSAKEITIETGTPPLHNTEVIRLSPELLTDYPMVWWSDIIVNPEVFDILDPHLDRDFFVVRRYKVD
jgi:hypothetical protein